MSFIAFWPAPLGNLFPRPGRLSVPSGANHASSCLFAEAKQGKAYDSPAEFSYSNCDIPAGRPNSESPHLELTRARKSKSNLERRFFSQLFPFFGFLMKFGELRGFSSIFVSGSGLFFGFWSVLQRLSIGLVVVLAS